MQWVRLSLSLSPLHASPLPASILPLAHFNLPLTCLVFFPLKLKGRLQEYSLLPGFKSQSSCWPAEQL